jgi:uncharacterized membrane protein
LSSRRSLASCVIFVLFCLFFCLFYDVSRHLYEKKMKMKMKKRKEKKRPRLACAFNGKEICTKRGSVELFLIVVV